METDHNAYIQQELKAYKELSEKLETLQKIEPLYKIDSQRNVIKQYPDGTVELVAKRYE